MDYPQRWPSFFNDLLQTLHLGDQAIDIYMRIMMAIDSEVVDREIVHTAEVIMVYYLVWVQENKHFLLWDNFSQHGKDGGYKML